MAVCIYKVFPSILLMRNNEAVESAVLRNAITVSPVGFQPMIYSDQPTFNVGEVTEATRSIQL